MAKSAEAEVEKMKILEERIKAPSIWGRVPCGVRFEDLQDKRYEDAVRMLKKHYLPEEYVPYCSFDPDKALSTRSSSGNSEQTLMEAEAQINIKKITFRSVKLHEDKEGTDEYIHNIRICMKDKMSIAAIKEGIDKLVGVLIMRIQEKNAFSRTFSRVKLTYNPLYSTVMTFYNEIEKPVNMFEKLGVKRYLKVYVLALKARYRHRGIAKEMLKAAMRLAASANVPALVGIFTTSRTHQLAEELGFQKYNEIYYVRYLIDEQIVFWDTGLGNYGAALMGYRIPDVDEPVEVKTQASSRFNIQPIEDDDDDAGGDGN